VNQRIKLYYGLQYGLSVKSEYQKGTCVSFIIPARNADSSENQVSLPADISVQLPHKAIGSTGEAGL
jgi:two-component system sensor histidine kinase YesM